MSASIKKIILIAVAVLVVFSIIIAICLAPRDRKYDEAEVRAAATALIKASEKLNDIYYGDGIKFLEYSENNKSLYCEADPTHLAELGFSTINELKKMTKEVFSEAHAEGMFSGTFSGTGTSQMSRYYQEYDDNRVDPKPLYIMVHREYDALMKGDMTYNFDTLTITGSKREYVNATIDVTVTLDGKTQTHTLNIRLIEEEAGWRLASTTFANYNEYQDIYDELQKG